jgi:hypothetical protein
MEISNEIADSTAIAGGSGAKIQNYYIFAHKITFLL